jgi:Putative metallopeptidase
MNLQRNAKITRKARRGAESRLLREPQMFLHEVSHARFDLLHIPILGHEVDAADQVAAYVMLQLGKDFARTTIVGVQASPTTQASKAWKS